MNAGEGMRLDFVGQEDFGHAFKAQQRLIGWVHVVFSCGGLLIWVQLMRTRFWLSCWVMSVKITLSPTCKPSRISTRLTEVRPSLTVTRLASLPSGVYLKIPMVLFSWPK